MAEDILTAIRLRSAKGYQAARTYRRFCNARDDVHTLLKLLDAEKKSTDSLLWVIVRLTNEGFTCNGTGRTPTTPSRTPGEKP